MASGFLRSREFAISLAVALPLLGLGAFLVSGPAFGNEWLDGDFACAAPATGGAPVTLAAAPGNASRTRTLSYALDPGQAAALDVCTGFGEVRVGPSPDALVHLRVLLDAEGASGDAPLDETVVRATLRQADGRATLAAWVERHATYAIRPGSNGAVGADIEILLPPQTPVDVAADAQHGAVRVMDVRVGELRIGSAFGDLVARGVDLAGNLTARTQHGEADVALASLVTGAVTVESDFGDVTLALPLRADVGYDVRASSGFGDARVQVGTAETYETGEHETHVRTAGYAEKPTRVSVVARTEFGDATVTAE